MKNENQKIRFKSLMRREKINQNDLLKEILDMIDEDSSPESINRHKSNFSKIISGERSIPSKYFIPLEKIFETSINYIVNGTKPIDSNFDPKGIRYAAFTNKIEEYEKLDNRFHDGSSVLLSFDEFGKSVLDYIIQYSSKTGLEYLVNNKNLYLDFQGTQLQGEAYSSQETTEILTSVIDLVIASDNSEVFEKFAHTWDRIAHNQEGLGALISENTLDGILSSNKIFNSLLSSQEIRLEKINHGLINDQNFEGSFCNPLLFSLLNYALKQGEKFDGKLEELLNFGINHNNKEKTNLMYISDLDKRYDVDDRGLICFGRTIYGSLITYKLEEQPDISENVSKLLDNLNKSINDFKFDSHPVMGGYSHHSVRLENGMIVKKSTNNSTEYDFLELMKENEISFVPRVIKSDNSLDYLTYFPGQGESYVSEMPWIKIKKVVLALKKINSVSREKLGENKVYVHGDLSPMNVIFNGVNLIGIIDWDSCSIGEEYEDLVYVMWTWLNIGSHCRNNEKIFQGVKDILKTYQASDDLKKSWADKMVSVMEKRLEETDKKALNYEKIFTWVKESEIWVELYREKMMEEIG